MRHYALVSVRVSSCRTVATCSASTPYNPCKTQHKRVASRRSGSYPRRSYLTVMFASALPPLYEHVDDSRISALRSDRTVREAGHALVPTARLLQVAAIVITTVACRPDPSDTTTRVIFLNRGRHALRGS